VVQQYSDRTPPPVPPAVLALPKLTIWPADTLRKELSAEQETSRQRALAMCLMPSAPINECIVELHRCVERALEASDNKLMTQLGAIALGTLSPKLANDTTDALLARLAALPDEGTQTHAAHALFRLQRLPAVAHKPIAQLLFNGSENLRKVANLCVTPFATNAASSIVEAVGSVTPSAWNPEALDALAKSCGHDAQRRKTVETFLLRGAKDQPLLPVGLAVFVALARMNPDGAGMESLVKVAVQTDDQKASDAALKALSQLGREAKTSGPALAKLLASTDDPAREEALCRLLITMETPAKELPVARIVERVSSAPDRSSAAHCMLIAFHAKQFQAAAELIKKRYEAASQALRLVLAETYKALTGLDLSSPDSIGRAS
jgi:hypothetical protein